MSTIGTVSDNIIRYGLAGLEVLGITKVVFTCGFALSAQPDATTSVYFEVTES